MNEFGVPRIDTNIYLNIPYLDRVSGNTWNTWKTSNTFSGENRLRYSPVITEYSGVPLGGAFLTAFVSMTDHIVVHCGGLRLPERNPIETHFTPSGLRPGIKYASGVLSAIGSYAGLFSL